MDLVTALGQLQSELGGNYATAAVSGITGNTNSHHYGLHTPRELDFGSPRFIALLEIGWICVEGDSAVRKEALQRRQKRCPFTKM